MGLRVPDQVQWQLLVVDDEPLLRGVVCDLLEHSIPGVRCRPAGGREEATALLGQGGIDQLVTEVRLSGANVSHWIGETVARHPALTVVAFSVEIPWLPDGLSDGGRVVHVEKSATGLPGLADACRALLSRPG